MLLSQTSEYALRAVLYIAECDGPVSVGEIAEAVGVPQNYLSKTLHQLARAGVLRSARGPAGGFRLATPASELTLQGVVSPVAGQRGRRCLLGHGVCGEVPDCAVHACWSPVASRVRDFFATTSVADLLSHRLPPPELTP